MALSLAARILTVALLTYLCMATVYIKEDFEDGEKWEDRWIESQWKKKENGKGYFDCINKLIEAMENGNDFVCEAIRTTADNRFYGLSNSELSKDFDTIENLIIQYSVFFPSIQGCGGGTIKVMPKNFDQKNFDSNTPYLIRFGPDVCGGKKKIEIELIVNGKKYQWKKDFDPFFNPSDEKSSKKNLVLNNYHIYRFALKNDKTYEVAVDDITVVEGSLENDFGLKLKSDENLNAFGPIGGVAFELYQMNSGTIFDNILLTDSFEEANKSSDAFISYTIV